MDYCVQDIHSHYPSQGYRSINDTLFSLYGWVLTDISVYKSMKRLGIKGYVRKQKEPEASGSEHNRYPNILNRQFKTNLPMQKIVTDVTYISHKGKWYLFSLFS